MRLQTVAHDATNSQTIAATMAGATRWAMWLCPSRVRTRVGGLACVDCGRRHGLELDHIDPVAHGGPTSYANQTPRCWSCHHDKTTRDRAAGLLTGHAP